MPNRLHRRVLTPALALALALAGCAGTAPGVMPAEPASEAAGETVSAAPGGLAEGTPSAFHRPPPTIPLGQVPLSLARGLPAPGAPGGLGDRPGPLGGPAVVTNSLPAPMPTATPAPSLVAISWPAGTEAGIDARLLVVAADRDEIQLATLTRVLDTLGTPYDVWIARDHPGGLVAERLAAGSHGHYQGVLLTEGEPSTREGSGWRAALTAAEWDALHAYEAAFKVRQVTWYTWPTAEYGFARPQVIDTTTSPLQARPTAAGAALFAPLNPRSTLAIRNAYAYVADALDARTTPLIVDTQGHPLAAIRTYDDGRENLAFTYDANPGLAHAWWSALGAVRWVTRGTYVGGREPCLSVQVDDVLAVSNLWGGGTFRLAGSDLEAIATWQRGRAADPATPDFKLDLAYNGAGATGVFQPDTLTPAVTRLASTFRWLDGTYTNADLTQADGTRMQAEIASNRAAGEQLHLGSDSETLVTGGLTGLQNGAAMQAAFAAGVRYVVTDASVPGEDNPSPGAGIMSALQPGLMRIPRRPTNLFYNVSTPSEWVSEYNALYHGYWGRDLDYAELLDKESETLLVALLRGDPDPWMFTQANLRAYDGKHSLLTDLIDRSVGKYEAIYTDHLANPTLGQTGRAMARRMSADGARVAGRVVGGSLVLGAGANTTALVTGTDSPYVPLTAGQTVKK